MNKLYKTLSPLALLLNITTQTLPMEKKAQQEIFNLSIKQATQGTLDTIEAAFRVIENLDLDKIDINARDSTGSTALHSAAALGSLKYVKFFIEHGAKPSMSHQGIDGNTPLHIAVWHGCEDVANYLLDQGASKIIKNNRGTQPWVVALHRGRRSLFVEKLTPSQDQW